MIELMKARPNNSPTTNKRRPGSTGSEDMITVVFVGIIGVFLALAVTAYTIYLIDGHGEFGSGNGAGLRIVRRNATSIHRRLK
jgi:hypothetical protein